MSSKKAILSRPRTRLYDANYNIGESYYKPALDRLDRKYSGRPLSPPRQPSPFLDDVHARIFGDEDLATSRMRASKHIREDNLFDSRGARINKAALLADQMESDFNEETAASARRLRAGKKVSIIDDPDLESASSSLQTHRMLNRSAKILDSVGVSERSSSVRRQQRLEDDASSRRALRVTFDKGLDAVAADDLTRWSPLEGNSSVRAKRHEEVVTAVRGEETSSAALRARQTKERLSDIEDEMAALQEKQAAREARFARLKKLVAETEAESAEFEVRQERNARRENRTVEY